MIHNQTEQKDIQKVPKRILSSLLASVSAGVVPRIGAPYIAIGRTDEIGALLSDLEAVNEGCGSMRQRKELFDAADPGICAGAWFPHRRCGPFPRAPSLRHGRKRRCHLSGADEKSGVQILSGWRRLAQDHRPLDHGSAKPCDGTRRFRGGSSL